MFFQLLLYSNPISLRDRKSNSSLGFSERQEYMINSLGLRYICVMGFSKSYLPIIRRIRPSHSRKKIMQRSRYMSIDFSVGKEIANVNRVRVEVCTLDKRIRVLLIAGQVAFTYV